MTESVYRYRWLLYELVVRDLVLRYRGSALGFIWTLLNPLLFLGVYTLVFSVYMRAAIPNYTVFLIAGLLPWQWFANSVALGTSSIIDGRMFIGKAVFAPVILVLVPVLSAFVNFMLSLPILLVIAFALGTHPNWPMLVLPVLVGIQLLLTVGIMLCLSTMNVFFRDLQQLVNVILMLLFYLSGIILPISSIPENARIFVMANPMVPLIMGYQNIFAYDKLPDAGPVLYSLTAAIAIFFVGSALFNRYKDAFADFV